MTKRHPFWPLCTGAGSRLLADRAVPPSRLPIEGSLTKRLLLQPFSDTCLVSGCQRRVPRHSVCAGPRGSCDNDEVVAIVCECRSAVWLLGEGDLHTFTPRQWRRALIDFATFMQHHHRHDRRLRREARALAQCITAIRDRGGDEL